MIFRKRSAVTTTKHAKRLAKLKAIAADKKEQKQAPKSG